MKHPALARVFAIVLAILSVLMLINGAVDFGKANAALQQSLDKYQRIEDKTIEYEELDAKLKNSVSYEEAFAELEKLQDEHDSDAAQHRTDLATHTATMGGYILGADMIRDGKEQLALAKAELAEGKKLLEEKEQQFDQLVTAFNALEPLLQKAIDATTGSQQEFDAAIAVINAMIARIDALMEQRPQPPELPEEPVPPVLPELPPEGADEETIAAYEQAKAIYDALAAEFEKALEDYKNSMTEYESQLAEYESRLAAWEQEYQAVMESVIADSASVESRVQNGSAMMDAALSQLPADVLDGLGGLPGGDMGLPDLSNMSLADIRAALVQFRDYLMSVGNVKDALQGVLNNFKAQIQEAQNAMDLAKQQIAMGEKALAKGEQELQHQLELLWWNMGKLEDEAVELEADKARLDGEAETLDRKLISVDEQKELERKHRSARIILMQENDIEAMVNDGGELAESARACVENGRSTAHRSRTLMYIINILAVLGAVFGILSIPGAFEKTSRRLLLITAPVLCLLCALGADGLNMYMGLGQMYTAMFTALAALLHLLVVSPKKRTIKAN